MGIVLCGMDLETSGLLPETDRIIEVGACVYEWDTKMPMQILSELVDPCMDNGDFVLPPEITAITGITDVALGRYGAFEKDVLHRLTQMATLSQYYVAHNAEFDRGFIEAAYRRHGMTMVELPWLDSMSDVRFPESIKTRNLKHLAAEHNFLPGFSHRSLFDVMTMLKIMESYDLEAIIARSKEPMVYVQANVTFSDNQKAKDFKFRWAPKQKIWWKQMKASDLEEEKAGYQFKATYLDAPPEEETIARDLFGNERASE
jgi:DNA polymerase III epsilon subunit-like protein